MSEGFFCDLCGKLFKGDEPGHLSGLGELADIEDDYCKECAIRVKDAINKLRRLE